MSSKKGRKRGLKLSNPRKLFMKKPVFDCLNSAELPKVPSILINYILEHEEVMNTEGLFRVPGNNGEIQTMLKTYSKRNAKPLDHNVFSPHTNACALKQWIRDMTDPLLTFELYDSWLACSAISDASDHLDAVLRCVGLLPKANRALLKHLCQMLNEVLTREETNKMSARNLAIVFGPTILRCEDESDPLRLLDEQLKLNKTVEVLVGNFTDIFDKESNSLAPKKPERPPLEKQLTQQEAEFFYKLQEGGVRIAKTIIVEQQKQSMQQLVAARPTPPEPWKSAEPSGEPGEEKPFVFPPPPAHISKPDHKRRAQLVRSFSKAMATTSLPVPSHWSTVTTPPCRPRRELAMSLQRADDGDSEGEEPLETPEVVLDAPQQEETSGDEAETYSADELDSALLSIEDIVNGIISGEMDTVQDYLASVECAEVVELHTNLTELQEQMKPEAEDEDEESDRSVTPEPTANGDAEDVASPETDVDVTVEDQEVAEPQQ